MKSWKKFLLAAVMLVMVGSVTQVYGIEKMKSSVDSPVGYENLWNSMTRKLGRGICNVAFGALELPIQIYNVNFEEGGFAACSYGVISGVGYVVVREVVGVVEIVTFPFPLPNCPNSGIGEGAGYGPILTPEWIITPETNWGNFVFSNTTPMN